VTVLAHAKINLTLEVFGKRPDGYHALRSLVAPVSLADTLDIEPTVDGRITSDTGYPDDLCVKAACALAREAGQRSGQRLGQRSEVRGQTAEFASLRSLPGVRIRVTKRIPVGGGLGGGSADAAATLRALNELWHLGKTPQELAEIGAAVGSDVPALVLAQHHRCPVLMEGRGERVTALSNSNFSLHLVLSNPGVSSSTKEVYAACTPRPAEGPSSTDAMVAAVKSHDLDRIAAALQNDLQAPAVRLHPEIGAALSVLKAAGATGAMMSGSGASVFGLVSDEATALRMSTVLSAGGLATWSVHTP